jgi:hypothetical protein
MEDSSTSKASFTSSTDVGIIVFPMCLNLQLVLIASQAFLYHKPAVMHINHRNVVCSRGLLCMKLLQRRRMDTDGSADSVEGICFTEAESLDRKA